jgi:inner membrane protein
MSPITHFFAGWLLASVSPTGKPTTLTRREKALVVAAAVAPDLDGLGIVPELLTRNTSHPLLWFSQYHHTLHTLAFSLVCTLAAYLIAGPLAEHSSGSPSGSPKMALQKNATTKSDRAVPTHVQTTHLQTTHPALTALLVFLSFHLHLLCDLIGARGPDGDQWPIPYLKPFSNSIQLTWHGQWALNGWQNFVITGLFLLATFWIAWKYGSSPVELVSKRWNGRFLRVLHQRLSAIKRSASAGD